MIFEQATGITLETTDVDYNFHFISSIPHQIQPPAILQKSQNKIPAISSDYIIFIFIFS